LEIVPFSSDEHGTAVQRLNSRLAAAHSEFQFPDKEPEDRGGSVSFEHFVAADQGEVLGGYLLKHQTFFLRGRPVQLDNLQLPLSLGLIDKRYSHVSAALLFDALGRNDLIYCLGMGSQESRLVKMLTAAGWRHCVTPFYFRIRSGNRFARQIRLPPGKARLQTALRMAGCLRLAGLALWARDRLRGGRALSAPLTAKLAPRFDETADRLFDAHAAAYTLVGDRRSAVLNCLYPEANPTFHRLLFHAAGQLVGWAVVLDTAMQNHNYFGNLRVGTIADAFAAPEYAAGVAAGADRYLSERGGDLLVSNQLHPAWGAALVQAGYREGPSNFFFYFSPELADQLETTKDWEQGLHVNRGDGDGPIHL
jgi:hypothetical protein